MRGFFCRAERLAGKHNIMTQTAKTKNITLSVRDVSVSYGAAPVIKNISLDVPEGESFGLIGLNGAGKTTLIKAILGLRDRIDGGVLINGQPATSPQSKAGLAYLPERFDPPSFLTGREFLQFSLRLYKRHYEDRVFDEAAERLAFSPSVLTKRVNTYSKGMRQKLGLLSTLLTECPLMILDEPMSGLDPMARALVKDALNEARWKGRTIFLSSHILSDMSEICDRIAVIHDRRIQYDGDPDGMVSQQKEDNLERAFLSLIKGMEAA
jgi:ABC-2 type transport system ATP-binding protein